MCYGHLLTVKDVSQYYASSQKTYLNHGQFQPAELDSSGLNVNGATSGTDVIPVSLRVRA